MEESNKKLKCMGCGMDEDEAREKGINVEKIDSTQTIDIEGGIINVGVLSGEDIYLCTECKEKMIKSMKSIGTKNVKDKIDAFRSLIDSYAYLTGLDVTVVSEACLKICIKAIFTVSDTNIDLAILLAKSTIGIFESTLDELQKEKMRREDNKLMKEKLQRN